MRLRHLLVAALLSAAGACQEAVPTSITSAIPIAHTITAESAGPITRDTAYSSAAIQRLFPGRRLEVIRTADELGVTNAITVFEDGLQAFQVIPASDGRSIRAVHGSGLAVAGPGGERLGTTFAGNRVSRDTCTVGAGPWAGMAVCPSSGAPNVRLVFDNGGWNGPATELPPQGVLSGASLQRIVWTPAPGA